MILVPFMKMPKSCNECAFSRLRFHLPNGKIGEGDEGKDGYNCQVEYWEKGRYETTRKAPCDELVIPENCPLINEPNIRQIAESEDKE